MLSQPQRRRIWRGLPCLAGSLLTILVVVGVACGGFEPARTAIPESQRPPSTPATVTPSPAPSPAPASTVAGRSEPSPTKAGSPTPVPSPTIEPTPKPLTGEPGPPRAAEEGDPPVPITIVRAFPDLYFRRMTNLVQPDDGRDMLFVTEQGGKIHIFPARQDATETVVFLDITGLVNEGGNEEGLLGLAFAPDYAESGHFYVYYSARGPRRSVLSRFTSNRDDPHGPAWPAS